MKKILFILLLFGLKGFSQENIDTVYVRNLVLRYGEWKWVVASVNSIGEDSLTTRSYLKIRSVVNPLLPLTNATNVTIDSLNAKFLAVVYHKYLNSTRGEQKKLGDNIETKLKAVPNTVFQTYLTLVEDRHDDIINFKNRKGKFLLE